MRSDVGLESKPGVGARSNRNRAGFLFDRLGKTVWVQQIARTNPELNESGRDQLHTPLASKQPPIQSASDGAIRASIGG